MSEEFECLGMVDHVSWLCLSLFVFVFVGWLLVGVRGCVCLWVALVTDLYKMAAMHDNEDLADFEANAEIAMSTAQLHITCE